MKSNITRESMLTFQKLLLVVTIISKRPKLLILAIFINFFQNRGAINSMKHKIELAAEDQGISENQLTLYMIAKELADLESNKPLYRYWIYARNWNDALLPFETRLTRIRVCEGEYSFLQ